VPHINQQHTCAASCSLVRVSTPLSVAFISAAAAEPSATSEVERKASAGDPAAFAAAIAARSLPGVVKSPLRCGEVGELQLIGCVLVWAKTAMRPTVGRLCAADATASQVVQCLLNPCAAALRACT
jgi:hypothetical protein